MRKYSDIWVDTRLETSIGNREVKSDSEFKPNLELKPELKPILKLDLFKIKSDYNPIKSYSTYIYGGVGKRGFVELSLRHEICYVKST